MNIGHFVLGIVLVVVFWAFQMGYMNSLGAAAWFLGAIIFAVIMFLLGKTSGEQPSEDHKMVWMFTMAFAIVLTALISFAPPSALGIVAPANLSDLTPLVLSIWLIVFGGAMFVGGMDAKKGVMMLIGVIWLFSAVHLALNTGPNSYFHFGVITGLSFVISGLFQKKGA